MNAETIASTAVTSARKKTTATKPLNQRRAGRPAASGRRFLRQPATRQPRLSSVGRPGPVIELILARADVQNKAPTTTCRSGLASQRRHRVPGVAVELAQECGTEPTAYLSEMPVLNSYALEDRTVYLTFSTTARRLEFMMGY
jgi:hypothetical protein